MDGRRTDEKRIQLIETPVRRKSIPFRQACREVGIADGSFG